MLVGDGFQKTINELKRRWCSGYCIDAKNDRHLQKLIIRIMKIEFDSIEPNHSSIGKEIVFVFKISEIGLYEIPIKFGGIVLTEDRKKIGDINENNWSNSSQLYLNAVGEKALRNNEITIGFSLPLNEKVINYIETHRHKNKSKEVIFKVFFNITLECSNLQISSLHLGEQITKGYLTQEYPVKYKNERNYIPTRNDMWILSGNGSPTFMRYVRYQNPHITVKIDLMNWVNTFVPYLETGNILVVELIQPKEIAGTKKFVDRFMKAQVALNEIKKQLDYGEWKTAIIVARPIVELFKNFDEFKKLLIDSGYSEEAYKDLKKSIDGFFMLLSKFNHGLAEDRTTINPDIETQREDAYFAYSYCVSLLHLISQKTKRLAQ